MDGYRLGLHPCWGTPLILRRELDNGEDALALYERLVRTLPDGTGIFCKEGYLLPKARRYLDVLLVLPGFIYSMRDVFVGLYAFGRPVEGHRTTYSFVTEDHDLMFWHSLLRECAVRNFGEAIATVDGKFTQSGCPPRPELIMKDCADGLEYWNRACPDWQEAARAFLEDNEPPCAGGEPL